ncbi:MAG: M3 family metallopeptidase [Bacteroidaceae bacterium]|nr:M3 family metallopeptidase [Bacteroidaceae bacterium]
MDQHNNNITVNPFLAPYDTPFNAIPYDRIKLEHFIPAVKEAIASEKECIESICNNSGPATFENTIVALDRSGLLLGEIIGAFNALSNACSNDEILAIEEEIELLCTAHHNDISLNVQLFARIKEVYNGDTSKLDTAQKRLLEQTYTSFIRNGANLVGDDRDEYRKLTERLSLLAIRFQENNIKDTDAFTLHVTNEDEIDGLPEDVKEAAANNAKENSKDGWLFTLHRPSYIPFITFCRNRELRRQMFLAYSTTCSKGNSFDNREIVKETVNTRLKLARLLGYNTYSDYILAERMAQNTDAVFSMLGKLTWSYLPVAQKELQEIRALARESEGTGFEFKPWDFAFYSEKLKEKKYSLSDEMVRPYFELNQAIYGMFYLATRLYGITFKQNHDIPLFNPDVKVWEVYDFDGRYLALLYCDFFARKGKHAGAWMDSIKPQYKDADGTDHRPHITLSTNYRKPLPGKPTLLNFDEVNTLMHEFGHCLHGILSDVTYASQCSPNVLWDFVEMPSQIMENFASEEELLKHFAFHHKTGENMPQEMLEKIKEMRTFNAGYQCVRQVGLGLIDQAWHNIQEPFEGDVLEYEHSVTAALRVMTPEKTTGITPHFGHIMSGGYAAGYYSYKWAEMLDADAYALFKKHGVLNMKIAQSFRENILSKGDSEHPMELYMKFRGHKPQVEPLLERDGIKTICPHL